MLRWLSDSAGEVLRRCTEFRVSEILILTSRKDEEGRASAALEARHVEKKAGQAAC